MTQTLSKPKELTIEEIVALEHIYLGPTWSRKDNGKFKVPKRTLGWQIGAWVADNLLSPDGHGGPCKLTNEQFRFLLWWYAVDENGRFSYRKGVLQRMKGWGKDPLLAILCLVELVGPSRFSHFDESGQPVGMPCPNAWVQVTAVNQAQTTNTMGMMPVLMSDVFKATYDIKDGAELIRALGGTCRLEAVTSSFRALEGKRTTFTLLNETHHWVSGNQGMQMYEVIDGNVTKMNARFLAITNAFQPGEDSVAEKMRHAYEEILEGINIDYGFMYDSIEANPLTPLTDEALRIVIPIIRGDSVWLNIDAIIESVQNDIISQARSRRMYLNQVVAIDESLYAPWQWDPLEKRDAVLKPGDQVTLGFDGGKTDDATALVAIRTSDNVAFVLGIWERPPNWPTGKDAPKWEVNRMLVDDTVRNAFQVYKVVGFYADVALWESYISDWEVDYAEGLAVKCTQPSPIGFDMRQNERRNVLTHERLVTTILDAKLFHDGDKALRRHVLNVYRKTTIYGVSFMKQTRESKRKVDLYAALMLAHEALHDFRTRGKQEDAVDRRAFFF